MQPHFTNSAILFPGQGVLTREICEYYSFLIIKDTKKTEKYIQILQDSLDVMNPQAKFDVEKLLADESSSEWNRTSFVQPLTYLLSVLTFEMIKNKFETHKPAFVLGHSLGAFSALTAAGALSLEEGIRLVAARGKFMQEESEKENRGMCAIIGLAEDKVREICERTGCVIALINAPTAFVVGGSRDVFGRVEEEALKFGARKTIVLTTSGAFHTIYMQGAYDKFKELVKDGFLKKAQIPVVTNIKGTASTDPAVLEEDIIESFVRPVDWAEMMEFLKSKSVESYVESGPGGSLSALCRLNGVEREKIVHAKTLLE
jgi:[acyl-carrier-protein] S-malonyltransferase